MLKEEITYEISVFSCPNAADKQASSVHIWYICINDHVFHWGTNIPNHGIFKPLLLLKNLGCAGVEIFLLLSGTGLYHSLSRNSN